MNECLVLYIKRLGFVQPSQLDEQPGNQQITIRLAEFKPRLIGAVHCRSLELDITCGQMSHHHPSNPPPKKLWAQLLLGRTCSPSRCWDHSDSRTGQTCSWGLQINGCCRLLRQRCLYMGVSKNRGTPKSSILIGFSIINHAFWGYHYFWKHPYVYVNYY